MWLTNVTCVVGQKELDYMVYMQAMFASPLAYLQQQTEFLRKDIGVRTWTVSLWPAGKGMGALVLLSGIKGDVRWCSMLL
jgi:hypothetical protein